MKTKILIFTFCLLLISFVTIAFSYNHARYVDIDSGDNANTGLTVDLAWKNLFYAVDQINNDTNITTGQSTILYVAPGTYLASAAATDINIVIRQNDFTIMGEGSATTILDGTGAPTLWTEGIRTEDGINNATITGLTIRHFVGAGVRFYSGTGNSVTSCELSGNTHGVSVASAVTEVTFGLHGNIIKENNYGINIESTNAAVSAEIKGNSISANTFTGIYIVTGSGVSSPVIKENTIFSNETGIETSIGSAASSPQILNNRIYDNTTGIQLRGGSLTTSSPQIINNIIYQDTGTMTHGIVLSASDTDSNLAATILHNTINGGSEAGIYSTAEVGTITAEIKYCIITNFAGGTLSYGIDNRFNSTLTIDYVDVWNNTTANFNNCNVSTINYDVDPKYASDYSLLIASPCIDKVPAVASDPIDYDIIGTSRPRKKDSAGNNLHDIGAYEYPYQSYEFTMPGGTGLATDYRLMTLPVDLSSTSLTTILTDAYGPYDDRNWRAFAWDGLAYVELGSASFDTLTYNSTLSSHAGRSFWVISLDGTLASDITTFEGFLTGNKQPQTVTLSTGWNMVALPWPASTANPSIELGNIVVKDDAKKFWLTSGNNTLTETAVWNYTGAGGYTKLESVADVMVPGKGYWINVGSASLVDIVFPPDNGVYLTASKRVAHNKSATSSEPPPSPPGSNLSADGGNGCFIGTL